ncbi:hypothetical protein IAU59_000085 [Kwoniella sp. CBS 9459]
MADPSSSYPASAPSTSSNPPASSPSAALATATATAQPSPPHPQPPPQAPIQPLRNPKYRHISRSAAKRESVQLLGSIKDLQLHFSRAGLVEHRPGAGAGVKSTGSSTLGDVGRGSLGEEEEIENRPPFPSSSSRNGKAREKKPFKDVELPRLDLEDARREARGIVSDVRGIWGLSLPAAPLSPGSASALPSSKSLYFPTNFQDLLQDEPSYQEYRNSEDVHTALVNTARSIRRIRSLALSISHESAASTARKASGSLLPPRLGGAGKLRSSLSTPSRPAGPPRAVSGGYTTERKSSLGRLGMPDRDEDSLGDLRKAALDVLAALRALEERLRVISDDDDNVGYEEEQGGTRASSISMTAEEDPDADSFTASSARQTARSPSASGGEPSEAGSSSMVFSEPEGYYDSDEDDLFNVNALAHADNQHTTTWEERIVSEQREYQVLDDNEWEKEARATREGVGKWVAVVERMFVFAVHGEDDAAGGGGGNGGALEDWAKEGEEDDGDGEANELLRIHSFLLSHLPLDLASRLPAPDSDDFAARFLSALSDGYILIHAYNASLLRSSKPWGFIPDEDVHDTLSTSTADGNATSTDEGGKKDREWTFRRVGNLTCWGAALRHRYQLPLSIASSTSTTAAAAPFLQVCNPYSASASTSASVGINLSTTSSGTSTPSRPNSGLNATSRPRPSLDTHSLSSFGIRGGSGSGSGKNREEIEFDPMMIAKRSPGWDRMLSHVTGRWVREIGKEFRESRGIRTKGNEALKVDSDRPTLDMNTEKVEGEGQGVVKRGGLI